MISIMWVRSVFAKKENKKHTEELKIGVQNWWCLLMHLITRKKSSKLCRRNITGYKRGWFYASSHSPTTFMQRFYSSPGVYKDDASSLEFACQAVAPCLALSYTESTPPTSTLPAPHPPFMFDYDQCYEIGAAHPWTHYIGLYQHLQSMKFDDTTTVKSKDLLALQGLIVQFKQLWGSYNYKEPVKHSQQLRASTWYQVPNLVVLLYGLSHLSNTQKWTVKLGSNWS